jgi:hypothetical protein
MSNLVVDSVTKLPLRLLVLFHPKSEEARKLALEVYRRFMATGSAPGLRIPVAFLPERDDGHPSSVLAEIDKAEHTLVIALVDKRMVRTATPEDRAAAEAWGIEISSARNAYRAHPKHGLVMAALDDRSFGLHPTIENASYVRLDRFQDPGEKSDDLAFQVAVAALTLLRDRPLASEPVDKAPIQIFVSHAKVDLGPDDGPVKQLLGWLAENPVDGWYDAKKIRPGASFDEELTKAVVKSDAFVCFLTDHWSEREWCRRELLLAKREGKPIVVVDALEAGVTRLFSYVGNARTLRWQPKEPRLVALAAMLEALRYRHAQRVLNQRKQAGDIVLGTLPEALTLRGIAHGTTTVLYPDPPLPREELTALGPVYAVSATDRAVQTIELTTPLQRLARWKPPAGAGIVGLSLSGATDIARWGASEEHLATFADDLATLLLLAGLHLAYGGAMKHDGAMHDKIDYTQRLFGLVRSYSPLAAEVGASRFHPILHFVSWPMYGEMKDEQLDLYGREAALIHGPVPAEAESELAGAAVGDSVRKWAIARGVAEMRLFMNQKIQARVVLAGKLEGYGGTIPGVMEEILIARGVRPDANTPGGAPSSEIPVYLLGAFGGAARLAIEQLDGVRTRQIPENAAAVSEFAKRGSPYWTGEGATAALRALAVNGPSKALGNGLTDDENRELFYGTDVHRLVELIQLGLGRRYGTAA